MVALLAESAMRAVLPARGGAARAGVLLAVLAGCLAAFLIPEAGLPHPATDDAGLVRLLRAMAAMKAVFAAGLVTAVLWRLQAPVSAARLLAYAGACGAMAAGPALIWTMAHLGLGALLLHGGLLAGLVLLWRDPACAELLAQAVARRRVSRGV